ncbi:NADH-ubiquinone oxidoreductase 12 kDa subunit [Phlegmacium glaucopus]|nr:NADH-ubiquinone oxidoreductase 12 kDa subunit [Phlegmacium glaucopus]
MVDEAKTAEIKAKLQEREELMRESWVKSMELRLVRDEVDKCHKAEGVNHYENCRWLAEKYLHMLRENRVKGYKVIDV